MLEIKGLNEVRSGDRKVDSMTNLVLMRGLPGSGKTTRAKAWVAEDPDSRVRVSRDDLRRMLFDGSGILSHEQESAITRLEERIVQQALHEDRQVVVDVMHLRARYIRRWEAISPVSLFDVVRPLSDCIEADAARERPVGSEVINSIAKRFGIPADGTLPRVLLDPERYLQTSPRRRGASVVWQPAPAWNPDLDMAIIVDTDGTLADLSHRSPYAKDEELYWQDAVIEDVAQLVRTLSETFFIIGVSGRSEEFRDVSERWWRDKAKITPDHFHMRSLAHVEQQTPDDIVKSDIFDNEIADKYNVVGVIDDRPRVVRMWRAKGLTTLAVGDQTIDF